MTAENTRPIIRTLLTADLKCYLCGGISGTVESEQQPLPRTVRLRKPGAKETVEVLDWRRLRCDRCGGPTYLDDPNLVTERVENYNWLEERPRRGRPPKRLIEERRRERELLEQQAA